MKILLFLIGFIFGCMAGIVVMCLVQVNKGAEKELRQIEAKKKDKDKKKEEKCKETS